MIVKYLVSLSVAVFACAVPSGAIDAKSDIRVCSLVVEETAGQLAIFDPNGRSLARVPLGERPHEIAVAPDGRKAWVPMFGIADYNNRLGTPGKWVSEIDLRTARVTGRLLLPPNLSAPHGVAVRPHSRELFINAEVPSDVMLVFDTTSRRLIRSFALPQATHNFIFSADGTSLFSFAGRAGVTRLDPFGGTFLAHIDIGSPARGLRLIPGAAGELAVAGKGEVIIVSSTSLEVLRRLPSPVAGQLAYLEVLQDGTIVAPSLSDNGVAIFYTDGTSRFMATGKTALVARHSPLGTILVSNVLDTHLTTMDATLSNPKPFGDVSGANGIAFGACPWGHSR